MKKMKVTKNEVKSIFIYDIKHRDPIRVFWQDFGKSPDNQSGGNRGMLTFVCFGSAWSIFWPAMGDKSIVEFFISAAESDSSYVLSKLIPQFTLNYEYYQKRYITMLIKTVANGLKKYLKEGGEK